MSQKRFKKWVSWWVINSKEKKKWIEDAELQIGIMTKELLINIYGAHESKSNRIIIGQAKANPIFLENLIWRP